MTDSEKCEKTGTMEGNYLIIVRRGGATWIVDEDSCHILESDKSGSPVLELQVQTVRAPGCEETDALSQAIGLICTTYPHPTHAQRTQMAIAYALIAICERLDKLIEKDQLSPEALHTAVVLNNIGDILADVFGK